MTSADAGKVTGVIIKQPGGSAEAHRTFGLNAKLDWLVIVERGPLASSRLEYVGQTFKDALKWASENL